MQNSDNIRLLLQLVWIIKFSPIDDKILKRKVQNVNIKYHKKAPYFWIDNSIKELILKIINKIVEEKKTEKIKNMKVYADKKTKKLVEWVMLNFSSREVWTQLWKIYFENWSYYPLDFLLELEWANLIKENIKESKEEVKKHLENKEQNEQFVDDFFNLKKDTSNNEENVNKEEENNTIEQDNFIWNTLKEIKIKDKYWKKIFLRMWILWKSKNWVSNDFDLSNLFIKNNDNIIIPVFYWAPELKKGNEVIAISSWDITESNTDAFSTEFIDIDIEKAKNEWYDIIMWYINDYKWNAESQEIYMFAQIINENDRILPKQIIKIDIDKLLFATKLDFENRSWAITYILNLNSLNLMATYVKQPSYKNVDDLIDNYEWNIWTILNDVITETNMKWIRIWEIIKKWLVKNKKDAEFILDVKGWNDKIINLLKLEWINKIKEKIL